MRAAAADSRHRRRDAWLSFGQALWKRVAGAGIARTAASLAFTTLLGVVPLFTVAFAYVARFSIFQQWLDALERVLLRFFLPGSGNVVRGYLAEFTTHASALTGVNIVFVVITTGFLIAQIEREINNIWGMGERRTILRRAILYVGSVTAAPVLVGATIYFASVLLEQSLAAVSLAPRAASFVKPFEAAAAVLIFAALYTLMPARRVRLRYAIAGAIFAAFAFELCRFGFVLYMRHVPTYRLVYGALSVLPIFLLWIYVSWVVVLLGAAVTATLAQRAPTVERPPPTLRPNV